MKDTLFKEFPEVSREQWKQQILSDLKGADYNEKLVYKSRDGIDIQPFYHPDDFEETEQPAPPGKWRVCEKITAVSAGEANTKAKEVLEKGAESLWFVIPSETIEPQILLSGINLKETPLFLEPQFLSEKYFILLQKYLKDKENKVYLQTDILGNLAKTGNWYFDSQQDHKILENRIKISSGFKSVVSIDASLYQNAGATIPEQLAFSLAHVNEYLNYLDYRAAGLNDFQPLFKIASGGNYFFEIAKVKALRWLYASLAGEYYLPKDCYILAQPTLRDKTLYDYNVNLLRTTTESMSAILGGADAVCNLAYDHIFHNNNDFGERIARNQLLVMKNEAYLDKVANPADGAYYIESLTRQFAKAALEIFKKIEAGGGFLKQLEAGIIQKQIKESAEKEQQQFDNGELILIGTNKFPNPEDRMSSDLEKDPFYNSIFGSPILEPIPERRLSERAEKERLEKEKTVLT
ncbi:methylmalonyl-CoA mutase subunit beta [Salinimicrobium marinum]|nr:methylmalonyl-CoA mutase subunit beta [Salinimicrobium marinum]